MFHLWTRSKMEWCSGTGAPQALRCTPTSWPSTPRRPRKSDDWGTRTQFAPRLRRNDRGFRFLLLRTLQEILGRGALFTNLLPPVSVMLYTSLSKIAVRTPPSAVGKERFHKIILIFYRKAISNLGNNALKRSNRWLRRNSQFLWPLPTCFLPFWGWISKLYGHTQRRIYAL